MLEIKKISKSFAQPDGSNIEAIADISLDVKRDDFVAIVGPSGCGKTTILKLIAGLERQTGGQLVFEDKKIISASQERGIVFQHFSSFPWLSVSENIAFGLRLKNFSEQKVKTIVSHYLKITDLEKFKNTFPANISGGMQQRVAIARTLANDPKILLMDEPFGSLDMQTRSQMQEFLTKLWEAEKQTILFITHDVGEAAFLADTVYVLGKRPMEIKNMFSVPFARPRVHALKHTKEFFEFENKIAQELEG